ncbi:MAG: hypothetical protein WAZ77_00015 [Candidatus Nitrosopolaris sp.]
MNQSEEEVKMIIHDLKALLKELEEASTMDEVKALLKRSKALMSINYITPEDLR